MAYNCEEDKNYEYETQFFGFTPKSFVDGGKTLRQNLSSFVIRCGWKLTFPLFVAVYNAINDYVSDCFGELEKLLSNEVCF